MSHYVRVSLTAHCDLACPYCRPGERPCVVAGAPVSAPELEQLLLRIHAASGVRKVRLTGGEPLLRSDVVDVAARLRRALPEAELALTTNGVRLAGLAAPLRAAGLDRINVSLDTLSRRRFAELTGRDALLAVLAGIRAARAAGFTPLRLNAVLLRSGSGRELTALVRFAAREGAEIRFIELMPLGPGARLFETEFLSGDEARERIAARLPYVGPLAGSDTAVRHAFRVGESEVRVGFISPLTHPFCGACDRLRLDSRGHLLGCLRDQGGVDLITPLRAGDPAEVDRRIATIARLKGRPEGLWPGRAMAQIGG